MFFLRLRQVLTGKQPFRDMKPPEFAYHVSSGLRPEKPANAEALGISDSLWGLIQKCWDGDKTRRPQIQEVVTGVGDAATSWHASMPPSGMGYQEDPISDDDSDELGHGELSSFHMIVPVFSDRPYLQLGYSSRTRATTSKLPARVPVVRNSAIHTPSQPNLTNLEPIKSTRSPCSNTWIRITPLPLPPFLRGNAKGSEPSLKGFLDSGRGIKYLP